MSDRESRLFAPALSAIAADAALGSYLRVMADGIAAAIGGAP